MNKPLNFYCTIVIRAFSVLIIAVLFAVFFETGKVYANNETTRFSEKVNLSLRRAAHGLLAAEGDSLSVIPPVKQTDTNTFTIRLNQSFDYGKLPQLLKQSLDLHEIHRPYDVSVINCGTGELQLGYNFKDMSDGGEIPCLNRDQEPGCYDLKLSFYPENRQAATGNHWWLLPVGSLTALLGYLFWKKSGKENTFPIVSEVGESNTSQKKYFGNSILDLTNLTLVSGNETCNLTYRETKLLSLFADHKNVVLERDFILKSVWEDEGIIVGRSVDVFVSRLRKILQNDSLLKISAVHGVGYRMEVNNQDTL